MIDFGIGGLSIAKVLLQEIPKSRMTYFSDTGSIPYGKLSAEDLQARLQKVFSYLLNLQVDAIVVACHAASTAVAGKTEIQTCPLFEVITPTRKWMSESAHKRIGIIGGVRTVESKLYENIPGKEIRAQSCQPLSIIIEAGQQNLPSFSIQLQKLLQVYVDSPVESLVLACTHYPAIQNEIQKLLPTSEVIDPAQLIVAKILNHFNIQKENLPHIADKDCYVCTGDRELMKRSALLGFDWKINVVKEVVL